MGPHTRACAQHLLWLPRVVAVCASGDGAAGRGGGGGPGAQLLLFPRFHLDSSSLLARYALAQARPDALAQAGAVTVPVPRHPLGSWLWCCTPCSPDSLCACISMKFLCPSKLRTSLQMV